MKVDGARALRMAMVVDAAIVAADEIRARAERRFDDYCRGDPIEEDDRGLAIMRFGAEPWRALLTVAETRLLAACDGVRAELGDASQPSRGPEAR